MFRGHYVKFQKDVCGWQKLSEKKIHMLDDLMGGGTYEDMKRLAGDRS